MELLEDQPDPEQLIDELAHMKIGKDMQVSNQFFHF
jgi:hypothetical protein